MKKLLLLGACIVPLFVHASYLVTIPVKDIPFTFKNQTNPNTPNPSNEGDNKLGNWIVSGTVFSDWVDAGDVYDYEDEAPDVKLECKWYGNPAMTEKDVEFTMYRYCYQDQERTPTVTEINDVTGVSRTRDLDNEKQQIETEDTKQSIGTRVDFEEYGAPNGKATSGKLQIVGAYSLDGVVVGSPIVNNKGSRIYLHFVHDTVANTYLIEIFGKDDDYAPSTTSYEGTFFKSYDYFQDINSINYIDSNGKVARVWLGSGTRTIGYQKNYSRFSSPISAAQFNEWYNNPNAISKFRIHLKSMDKY
jgi:hypothetical protein